ncbi:hypothetical protein [Paratractidigestivibacter sp.]|uniref:hypothetical protein n=1 Tax=Paratractidigestivibacter sp. TaxID=2847316 RepID=UPI002AC8A39A|nr:hypothetical protein [Paratractidigestivibacter sp.]
MADDVTRSSQMEAFAKRVAAEANELRSSIKANASEVEVVKTSVAANASSVGDTTVDLVKVFEAELADS